MMLVRLGMMGLNQHLPQARLGVYLTLKIDTTSAMRSTNTSEHSRGSCWLPVGPQSSLAKRKLPLAAAIIAEYRQRFGK